MFFGGLCLLEINYPSLNPSPPADAKALAGRRQERVGVGENERTRDMKKAIAFLVTAILILFALPPLAFAQGPILLNKAAYVYGENIFYTTKNSDNEGANIFIYNTATGQGVASCENTDSNISTLDYITWCYSFPGGFNDVSSLPVGSYSIILHIGTDFIEGSAQTTCENYRIDPFAAPYSSPLNYEECKALDGFHSEALFSIVSSPGLVYTRTPTGDVVASPLTIRVQGVFGVDFCTTPDSVAYRVRYGAQHPTIYTPLTYHTQGEVVDDTFQLNLSVGTWNVISELGVNTIGALFCENAERRDRDTIGVDSNSPLQVIPPNTPAGTSVIVGPLAGVTLEFSQVTQEGQTTVATSTSGTAPPSGFKLGSPPLYYSILTTAVFTPPVEICITYDEGQFRNERNLKLMHFENGVWTDVTTSRDANNHMICGVANSFSDFGVFEELQAVSIDIKPGSYPNSINLGSGGSVPVAIFSSVEFDATTIDPLTVTLASAPVQLKGKGTPMASSQDVNNDGLLDLVVHVSTEALQLSETDTSALFSGLTFDQTEVIGNDTIRVVP